MRRSFRRAARGSRGFNLTELMVVLMVVAILGMLSATSARWVRDRARMGVYYGYLHDVKEAALHFKQDMGYFPPDVGRGVDPGMITREGYLAGSHSPSWDALDLSNWHGPYLGYKRWPKNPWGGDLEWDYLPEGDAYGALPGPGMYLTSRPKDGGGREGLPHQVFEEQMQGKNEDKNGALGAISLYMGEATTPAPGGES